jgi:hypothetical protein
MNLVRKTARIAYVKYSLPFTNYHLIRWLPKSSTAIHGHDGKQCDFIILNGSLHEYRYLKQDINSRYRSQRLNPLTINNINDDEGYHQVFNFDDKEKWSIHRYY